MSVWIDVNGARIEKDFFEANGREANSYQWTAGPIIHAQLTHLRR
jgi:hypothetical protein